MAQVAISFNKRSYRFECSDGDAARLETIAGYVRDKLDVLIREHGAVGDERLVLMAALMLADELFEARADIDELLEEETGKLKSLAETVKGLRGTASAAVASGSAGADSSRKSGNGS